jgi:hypothetical protein
LPDAIFGDFAAIQHRAISDIRNNQRQKVLLGNDYEFEKRVDDLRKEVELRGFEPLTS